MSFYERHIMPRFVACACATRPIMWYRDKVVPLAQGKVLELGAGGGLNFKYYDPRKVSAVVGIDPSPELRARADLAPRAEGLKITVADGRAEALPFADASFDSCVCTFTLCSVSDPAAAARELARVVRPGGKVLFAEHGRAPDAGVQKWQRRVEPIWKRLAGGCHLTRPPTELLTATGLKPGWLKSAYAPKTPPIVGWVEWGALQAG